jgi:hypothetical protein
MSVAPRDNQVVTLTGAWGLSFRHTTPTRARGCRSMRKRLASWLTDGLFCGCERSAGRGQGADFDEWVHRSGLGCWGHPVATIPIISTGDVDNR